jgi:flagellar hook-length control protein FliK
MVASITLPSGNLPDLSSAIFAPGENVQAPSLFDQLMAALAPLDDNAGVPQAPSASEPSNVSNLAAQGGFLFQLPPLPAETASPTFAPAEPLNGNAGEDWPGTALPPLPGLNLANFALPPAALEALVAPSAEEALPQAGQALDAGAAPENSQASSASLASPPEPERHGVAQSLPSQIRFALANVPGTPALIVRNILLAQLPIEAAVVNATAPAPAVDGSVLTGNSATPVPSPAANLLIPQTVEHSAPPIAIPLIAAAQIVAAQIIPRSATTIILAAVPEAIPEEVSGAAASANLPDESAALADANGTPSAPAPSLVQNLPLSAALDDGQSDPVPTATSAEPVASDSRLGVSKSKQSPPKVAAAQQDDNPKPETAAIALSLAVQDIVAAPVPQPPAPEALSVTPTGIGEPDDNFNVAAPQAIAPATSPATAPDLDADGDNSPQTVAPQLVNPNGAGSASEAAKTLPPAGLFIANAAPPRSKPASTQTQIPPAVDMASAAPSKETQPSIDTLSSRTNTQPDASAVDSTPSDGSGAAKGDTSVPKAKVEHATPSLSELRTISAAPASSAAPQIAPASPGATPHPAAQNLTPPIAPAWTPATSDVDAPIRVPLMALAGWPDGAMFDALALKIAAKSSAGDTNFQIRLDPPELGRIEVNLNVDASGNAQASLTADKAQTLDLLQRDSGALERALKDAGLDLTGGLSFSLKGEARSGAWRDGQSGRSRSLNIGAIEANLASTSGPATPATYGYGASGRLDITV